MFRTCELVVINKIDVLERVDVDLAVFLCGLGAVHSRVEHMLVSARGGEGLDELRGWLERFAGSGGKPAPGGRSATPR